MKLLHDTPCCSWPCWRPFWRTRQKPTTLCWTARTRRSHSSRGLWLWDVSPAVDAAVALQPTTVQFPQLKRLICPGHEIWLSYINNYKLGLSCNSRQWSHDPEHAIVDGYSAAGATVLRLCSLDPTEKQKTDAHIIASPYLCLPKQSANARSCL